MLYTCIVDNGGMKHSLSVLGNVGELFVEAGVLEW